MLSRTLLVLTCVSLSSALRILSWPHLNCSQQGLMCHVSKSNCLDPGWTKSHEYTPASPDWLDVDVIVRSDKMGQLHPVLDANWTLKDDGSIRYLTATELHVLVHATNENQCIRYSFQNTLSMRNPKREKWSFSANMVVVNPGESYQVSVVNIPKPEVQHSVYDISVRVDVPPCEDPTMKNTQFCIERGSLWQPNISVAQMEAASGRRALTVSFNPDRLCEEYIVIVSCEDQERHNKIYRGNQTTIKATFSLDHWHRSCCTFEAQVKPIFPKCDQDCTRCKKRLNICPSPPDDPASPQYTFVIVGVVFLLVAVAAIMWILCRKSDNPKRAPSVEKENLKQPVKQIPKVLVIYSQDHALYRDVVLKLCAFLQAECGIQVLMDQLDTTWVSTVGRLRWLEWQRQQLKNPWDKILVLCSRGVQAKWRAMCGHGRVMLREDVLSPTDDMLTPFLNLFLPDMHQAGMHGRYVVAYFDDVCGEGDVPSVFDIAVKYKLMKHFEELYFRILGVEKYQPDQVKQVERIGEDEYFKCRSGRALRNAIEAFRTYQLENPDWFEKECVDSEEEAIASVPVPELETPSVLESLPLIREGLPTFVNEVEIIGNGSGVHVVTPELNLTHHMCSIAELTPQLNSGYNRPSYLNDVTPVPWYPQNQPSVHMVEPVLINSPPMKQTHVSIVGEPMGQIPIEHEEEEDPLSVSHPTSQSISMLCTSDDTPQPSLANILKNLPRPNIGYAEPIQMDEEEVLELIGKDQNSGSDQGYISKMSSQEELPLKEDPLMALARLQEELYQQNLAFS